MPEPLPAWAPSGVDADTPSAARIYDCFLGGTHHFAADRAVAGQMLALVPDIAEIVQANRAFLHRAVRHLAEQGLDQFIDLGSGIPSVGNVHDTARQVAPGSRVLYVDHDPVAVAHSTEILRNDPDTRVLSADLLAPETVLDSTDLIDLIDLDRPVGVLMVSVLHFIEDDELVRQAIEQFRQRVVPGSALAITHVVSDAQHPQSDAINDLYAASANPITLRTRSGVVQLFEGWDLTEPGAVWLPQWHPDQPLEAGFDPSSTGMIAAVGRKP